MKYKKINKHLWKIWAAPLISSVVLFSSNAFSQITLKVKQANAKSVINAIEQQSGYRFVYDESSIKFPSLNANLNNASIEKTLAAVFANTAIDYKIVKKNILLKNSNTAGSSNSVSTTANEDIVQNYLFTGRVINEAGTALSGASVKLKNTAIATSTDENGEFKLESPVRTGTLQISFLGHQTIEVAARTQMTSITLPLLPAEIEEIAVNVSTGYQTIAKERVTGAFAQLPKESLKQQRLNNLSTLLEGRIAGYHDGRIRGTTSMNGTTAPLYVVDGFPVDNNRFDQYGSIEESLPNINLEDIESITVLRDAAAASIYGARAANGVVVIVTKKGKAKGTEINASAVLTHTPYYFNTDRLTSSADLIDIEKEWAQRNTEFAKMSPSEAQNALDNMQYYSTGIQTLLREKAQLISVQERDNTLSKLATQGYRYYDDVAKYGKRNPFSQQYNLGLSSGSEKNRFYASSTYQKNLAENINSKDDNLGINIRNITQVNSWLSVELSSYIRYGREDRQTYDLLNSEDRKTSVLQNSPGFTYLPYDGLTNADGSHFISTAAMRMSQQNLGDIDKYGLYNMDIHPLDEMNNNIQKMNRFSNRSFIRLNTQITDWLSASSAFQYEYSHDKSDLLYDKNSYYVRNRVNSFYKIDDNGIGSFMMPYGNIYNFTEQNINSYNFRQQVDINKTFQEKHNLNAIAGLEIRNNKVSLNNQTLYNYDPDLLTSQMIDPSILSGGGIFGGTFNQSTDQGRIAEVTNRFVSFYGNAGYTYDNRLMLTGSLRWDRSNLWGTSSKYQNKPIWSLGAGWNLHNESFFNVSAINQLKIRSSYGIGGNIDNSASPYMTAYYNNNANVGGISGTISTRPNPLLSWEKTTTFNIGTDFGLFNNRFYGSLDYYRKEGADLLANTQGVPTEGWGYSTYKINNGEMTNHGFETTLSGHILEQGSFSWNSNLLYAYNKNKVTYVNVEAPVYVLQLDYPEAFPRIGNPYQAIYGYDWAGLNDNGIPQVYDAQGKKTTINPNTLESIVYAGSKVPYHTASWTNSLSYKNFDFSIMLTYEGGHRIRNTELPYIGTRNINWNPYTNVVALSKDIVDRWRQPGDENKTDIPRLIIPEDKEFYSYDSGTLYQNANINVIDASNFQIRNISLAYRLPSSVLSSLKISQARVQFNAENVAFMAKSNAAKYMLGGYRAPNYVMGVYLTF